MVELRRPQQAAPAGAGRPPQPCGRRGDGGRRLWCTVVSGAPASDLAAPSSSTSSRPRLRSVLQWSPGAVALSSLEVGVGEGTGEIRGRLCRLAGGAAHGRCLLHVGAGKASPFSPPLPPMLLVYRVKTQIPLDWAAATPWAPSPSRGCRLW